MIVALWTVQALLVGVFVFVAVAKLSDYPSSVADFDQIGLGDWFRYVTGAIELAGAIGMLIPRLAGLAALGLVVVMIGATVTNLLVLTPGMALVTITLGAASAVVAVARWSETRALVESLMRR
nr:DoxX family protein [Kibdelosporangium sp. MJ126-NF4]CEL13091.1 hypothetical protein [Kibdelosporangium sp. MJ126-NF4]CTQ98778.1 hypothetical protein [Kibdelosporangium sp. MJ126-NF4]